MTQLRQEFNSNVTQNGYSIRSVQQNSEQEMAAARREFSSESSITEPFIQRKKKVSLISAKCTCKQMLTSSDGQPVEGGLLLQPDEGLVHQVPAQVVVAEPESACIDAERVGAFAEGAGRAGVVEPWIELKSAAPANYGDAAATASSSSCASSRKAITERHS